MPTRTRKTPFRRKPSGPMLTVTPHSYLFPYKIRIVGEKFGPCPVTLMLREGEAIVPLRVIVGEAHGQRVKPARGAFEVLVNLPGLKPGKHALQAVSGEGRQRAAATAEFEYAPGPLQEKDGRPTHRWWLRQLHFLRTRFPDGQSRLPGSRLRALDHRDRLRRRVLDPARARKDDGDQPAPPVDPGCNWYCIGPSVVRRGQVFGAAPPTYTTAPISGRITSIAIDPNDTAVVYAAAAQGGVWKSTDGGLNWRPKSDYEISLAIGCVTVDPSVTDAGGRSTRILAGTGEPNGSDAYYGGGMLFSDDGGETWAARGTATFVRDEFSTIAVDPANSQHLFAATSIGVYESTDEGVNWNQLTPGSCFDLVVDWANVGGTELYAGRSGSGIRYSADGGATWSTLAGGLPGAGGRIALAMAPGNPEVIYAAFASGAGISGIYVTTDGGTTWNKTAGTPAGVAQSSYNLVLAVDPTDTSTVLFGEVHLWRTTDAGATWTKVSTGSPGIHADQHAIAFHPSDGNKVYVGNDGGVFYSSDGGQTYAHRNKDLATLQYFGIASHSQWDAVLLGGTQDNGAQRYLGHPAWEHSALGDAAFAAINATTDTRRWYETRWYSFPSYRNDSAGDPASWNQKKAGITTNSNWFYPPFAMDPNDSSVLYVGYDELWRSSDHAETWTDVTGSLVNNATNITAIAIAPSDSNTLYLGMTDGKVFKVTFSGGTWTANNVTGAPLPAGQISDIAVHPSDSQTLYVTTSNLIFSEGIGEFTNDHVFRSADGGATWSNVSAALSQANPVNAVVVDPVNPNTVFIGCDVGIFRSDDAGATWNAWDEGLPNCSVQDLDIFAPKRLLRAATHGRSIWERPIDAAACPLSDVYMRDDVVDTGLTLPTPSGVEHPFVPGDTVYWYQSVDIKVDSPDPVTNQYQTPGSDIDYLQFEEMEHDNPRRETYVRVYAQVHNRGALPASNVRVRAFWANAGGGLPNLPADFWTAFPNVDPADTSVWHPVGPARTVATVYPGQPAVCSWAWLVPDDAPGHSCMLCAVTSDEDAVSTSSLSISTAVRNDNNVTLKNLHVEDVVPGATGSDTATVPMFIDFELYAKPDARVRPLDIRINPGTLPVGARVKLFFPRFRTLGATRSALRGTELKEQKGIRLPRRPDEVCGSPTRYNTRRAFVIPVRGDAKGEMPGVYGILPIGEKFSAAIIVEIPGKKTSKGARYSFHVEHWVDNVHVGGSSYELRVPETRK